jgi:hypothetical protein
VLTKYVSASDATVSLTFHPSTRLRLLSEYRGRLVLNLLARTERVHIRRKNRPVVTLVVVGIPTLLYVDGLYLGVDLVIEYVTWD